MSLSESGEHRRDAGTEAVLAAAAAAHREYREYAEHAIALFAWEGDPFTADDVHDEIPDGVEPHSPNVLPAVIRTAARQGLITHIGWRKSARPSRHASVQRIWKGVRK